MSANGADTGQALPPLTGTGEESLSFLVHPALTSLMLAHTFLILLLPLVLSLFHFSTPQTRRRPVFSLNLAAIFLAFVVAVLLDVLCIHEVLEPLNPLPLSLSIAIGFLGVWESIFVDLILLVRLVSVYPPSQIGLIRFALFIATPVLLKLTRIINVTIFATVVAEVANESNGVILTEIIFETKPYLKVEWATQMIDNTYVSLAFLWAIRDRRNANGVKSTENATFPHRLRTLFRIALSNFVLPTIFSIAQFISVYRGVNMDVLEQLVLGNIMLSTFGVAFATVWAGNISRGDAQWLDSKPTTSNVMPVFAKGSAGISYDEMFTEEK